MCRPIRAEIRGGFQRSCGHLLAAQPAQDRVPLGAIDVVAAQLGLRQPEHRPAQLASQQGVAQEPVLQGAPHAAVELTGVQLVRGSDLGDGEARLRGHVHRVVRGADQRSAQRVPVDLAGHGEQQLVDLVQPDVLRRHGDEQAAGRVRCRPNRPLQPRGGVDAAGDRHLHRGATAGQVAGEVLLAQEVGVVGHGQAATAEHPRRLPHACEPSGSAHGAVNDAPQ